MALIKCQECLTEVSDSAEKCPKCAHPIKKKRGCLFIGLKWTLILFAIAIVASSIYTATLSEEERAALTDESNKRSEKQAIETAKRQKEQQAAVELRAQETSKREAEEKAEKERQNAEEIAKKQAEEAENKRKGFHCLSSWDGSQTKVVELIKSALNDPDSFDHDETMVSPIKNGMHRFTMRYRAKNAFGGVVVGNASGTYNTDDCSDINLTKTQ